MNNWIAVDWGTTNFRAFLMQGKHCIEQQSEGLGLLQVEPHRYQETLYQQLETWLKAGPLPIVMAGMVGSQQGWKEAPYVSAPCSFADLAQKAISLTTSWLSPVWIIPGVSCQSPYHQPDVMRGEEVQLAGLIALNAIENCRVILPGTHSKHVTISQGAITGYATYMTGELYSLLIERSILGKALPGQQESQSAFLSGVSMAQNGTPLSHLIFSARTRRLNKQIPEAHIADYLSGLMIGSEMAALTGCTHPLWCVGSPKLTQRYIQAAEYIGLKLNITNGDDCFIHGITYLYQHLSGEIA